MSATAILECSVCLQAGCDRDHGECSPPGPHANARITCDICGERMREPSPDGLCGFCQEEAAHG